MKSLSYVDVSANSLSGQIPCDMKTPSSLLLLNASENKLSGPLCNSLSNLKMLSVLDLHNNALSASLPPTLSNLAFLTYLDLSGNKFEGSVPLNICDMKSLSFVNFSGNKLSGYAPETCANGVLSVDVLPLSKSQGLRKPVLGIVISASFAFILLVLCLLVRTKVLKQKAKQIDEEGNDRLVISDGTDSSGELLVTEMKEPLSINLSTFQHSLTRFHRSEILSTTENFSQSHVIGEGGFGMVYKAALPDGRIGAVKRLSGGGGGPLHGDRGFLAEMETIGKVCHENLVSLFGYFVFREERFLIYEYMENGSLNVWLRNRADGVEALNWPNRFKICLGSAKGIAFLHHGFVPHIIHRDIKSSNILLDGKFEPKVYDFGLARIISACDSHASTDLAGTLGYIPPEYGQRMEATYMGDVYSFGVVMLELVTGRAPTGQSDLEGGNLVGWVRQMVAKKKEDKVLDEYVSSVLNWRGQMLSVVGIAKMCTSDDRRKRHTMLQVVKQLLEIQAQE